MGRPREFDEDAVLEAATERFWNNGYEATSMRDLADHTGMTTPSLYNAFSDKRAIYRLVLDRYVRLRSKPARRSSEAITRPYAHWSGTSMQSLKNRSQTAFTRGALS